MAAVATLADRGVTCAIVSGGLKELASMLAHEARFSHVHANGVVFGGDGRLTAQAVVEARRSKLHVSGLWAGVYNVAKAVRELGYSAKDFHPENSIYVGGGLKRAKLPGDYREFVYETFNIGPERHYQNYSMQELHSGMPRCREGGRYHVPPWAQGASRPGGSGARRTFRGGKSEIHIVDCIMGKQ